MSGQGVPKKYASEAERKKAYREKLKNELGLEAYLEQQRNKKKEQRAKAKGKQTTNKSEPEPKPQQQPEPPKALKQSLITSYFKPMVKPTPPPPQPQEKQTQPKPEKRAMINTKPMMKIKDRALKEAQKAKKIEDEINKKILNVKPPVRTKKPLDNIKPLHVKYEGKKVEKKTVHQYLSKLKTIYNKIFKSELLPGVEDELQKLIEGKEFNQGVINHLLFFKRIKFIINEIKKIYNKDSTISSYLNAITSILSRIPYFKEEYNIISVENNLYSSKYKNKRDLNILL